MNAENISYLSIVTLMIFLVPVIVINKYFRIKINSKIFYAIGRMAIQLSLVGIFLQYIFDLNNWLLNLLYVLFMISVASFSTVRSCSIDIKKYIFPVFMSLIIPNLMVLLFFNTFVVQIDGIFDARYLIPIGGMLLGNCLTGNIIGINRFYKTIQEREKEYLYLLSLSASKMEALRLYIKDAILASVKPTIASIETIGLVALPGMMTGQILGGSVPITAIKYQIAIMIAIFISRYLGSVLAIFFTSFKAFDDYDLLAMYK